MGAAMMGEWKVTVDGKEMLAAEALKARNIKPLVPQGKDGLGILSTNSVGMAMTMNAVKTMRQAIEVTPVVFGLTLEGMNGNVAPFLAQTVNSHPLLGLQKAAANFRTTLEGSYLWEKERQAPAAGPALLPHDGLHLPPKLFARLKSSTPSSTSRSTPPTTIPA